MKGMTKWIWGIALMFLFTGFFQPGFGQVVVIKKAPPVLRVEVKPAPPFARAVWIPGHWVWRGHTYVWVKGHWVKPRKGFTWVPGHWNKKRHGWVWIPGHWKRV